MHYNPHLKVYLNNVCISQDSLVSSGDVVDINGCEITFNKSNIEIINYSSNEIHSNLIKIEKQYGLKNRSVIYQRSPRIVYQGSDDPITIAAAPQLEKQEAQGLVKVIVPPLITTSVTVVMSLMLGCGPYVYLAMVTALVSIIMSVTNFVGERKKRLTRNKNRTDNYQIYLKNKLDSINSVAKQFEHALNYHSPPNEKILIMLEDYDSRLYEKKNLHHDFLEIRIGLSEQDYSFKVNFEEKEFNEDEDDLAAEAKIIKDLFIKSKALPQTIKLNNGSVGLVGSEQSLREQVALVINQLAFFHSYHDVEIFHVFKEDDLEFFSAFDFLPHLNSKLIHARANVYSQKTRDQILNSMYQVIKARHNQFEEKKSGSGVIFEPNIVLIISDIKQIIDHSIMEFLSKETSHLGVHCIYVDRTMKNLPEHVNTVVEYKNLTEGRIINEDNIFVNKRFLVDHVSPNFNYEMIPRILAGYEHVQTLQSSIPEKVGFLEMFSVESTAELNISERWSKGDPGKSLAVPLGYRAEGDIVYLNLHEKAHGPHGLVAGTTGSGKSEIVQSYILSLALNFHPHDVGFLLIDYKGGGMANLFKDLPHLLGTITNLDKSASMRALISIKAELLRRQQTFLENDVNHIDGYQKLFKEGLVKEPIPHLFMISDEFAELKSEQPDFMKELVSTARIGRSLGIHLILATQKPRGVVDDQIWSNSKFILCLKVVDDGRNSGNDVPYSEAMDTLDINYIAAEFVYYDKIKRMMGLDRNAKVTNYMEQSWERFIETGLGIFEGQVIDFEK